MAKNIHVRRNPTALELALEKASGAGKLKKTIQQRVEAIQRSRAAIKPSKETSNG